MERFGLFSILGSYHAASTNFSLLLKLWDENFREKVDVTLSLSFCILRYSKTK